jgi:tRNA(Arg) A34 adenosine deaminase TadA
VGIKLKHDPKGWCFCYDEEMNNDQYFLKIATDIGNKKPKPYNFGACIVKDGEIIAQDFNHVHELHDPTAHAETSAIRKAAQKLGTHNLDGCTMYGSHEPCVMCFSCAAWANIGRVVYALPASEQSDFTYEFQGLSLNDLASKLARRDISVEMIRLK